MNGYDVMTPDHHRWDAFCARLEMALGDPHEHRCSRRFEAVVAILSSMGLDVHASLDWLREQGASCDCEVMLNVVLHPTMDDESAS